MKDGRNAKYKMEEVRKYKKQKNKRKNAKKTKGKWAEVKLNNKHTSRKSKNEKISLNKFTFFFK